MDENTFKNESWAQEGEDILINRILNNKTNGIYCDVGSHHPYRFSNTYALYKKGWRGITIDATPGISELFNKYRPRDININCAVAEYEGEIEFDCYNEGALNSAVKERRENIGGNYSITQTVKVECAPLNKIIEKYAAEIQEIDLLSVDIEGYDEIGIKTFDFIKFRPKLIVAEIGWAIKDLHTHPTSKYLESIGYELRSYLYLSAFFIHKDS